MERLRIISPNLHGFLDYGAAVALILLPFLLNLGAQSQIALWLSVAGGLGLIIYSLLTDYALAVASLLSFRNHLKVDLGAAAIFLIAPFVLGFTGLVMSYYLVMGAGVVVVVALSRRDEPDSDGLSASAKNI